MKKENCIFSISNSYNNLWLKNCLSLNFEKQKFFWLNNDNFIAGITTRVVSDWSKLCEVVIILRFIKITKFLVIANLASFKITLCALLQTQRKIP